MTVLYWYLGFCVVMLVVGIGIGLYEDLFKQPDHKFGRNIITKERTIRYVNSKFEYGEPKYKLVSNGFFWIFVGLYSVPIVNIIWIPYYCWCIVIGLLNKKTTKLEG